MKLFITIVAAILFSGLVIFLIQDQAQHTEDQKHAWDKLDADMNDIDRQILLGCKDEGYRGPDRPSHGMSKKEKASCNDTYARFEARFESRNSR